MQFIAQQIFYGLLVELLIVLLYVWVKDKRKTAILILTLGTLIAAVVAFFPFQLPFGRAISTPLQDLRVRRAIAYCTDRYALAASVYPELDSSQINNQIMDSFLPKTHWAYSQPEYQYPFDPALGQSLLEEAGWNLLPEKSYRSNEQGEELSFEFTTTVAELRQTWAAVFEIQLQACGIRLIRRNVTGDWWFGDTTGLKQRDFEIGAFAWVSEWDLPVNSYYGCDSVPSVQNGFQGDNFMGWCNRTASDAADQASNALLSQTERKTAFVILQNEFAKDLPSIPLFLRDDGATWEHIDFNIRPYFP